LNLCTFHCSPQKSNEVSQITDDLSSKTKTGK
jgi:hypothetical protein